MCSHSTAGARQGARLTGIERERRRDSCTVSRQTAHSIGTSLGSGRPRRQLRHSAVQCSRTWAQQRAVRVGQQGKGAASTVVEVLLRVDQRRQTLRRER